MKTSFLSSQLKRTGDILRNSASNQISDYARRFDSLKGVYDGFLKDLLLKDFDDAKAVATSKDFFGSERVRFAAIDGTEYTCPLFDLVIFFGGAYAAKGTLEFGNNGSKAEYSTRFTEKNIGVSSCVPIYVNEVVDIEQTYMEMAEGEDVTVERSLTDETVINNSSIANWIMTLSELYLAYKLAKQSDVKILLLDRSLCTTHSSLVYDTRRRRLWNYCAILGHEIEGKTIDHNDLQYNRHRLVNQSLHLPPARGDYLRYSIVYLLEDKSPMNFEEICEELRLDNEDQRKRAKRFLSTSVTEKYLQENQGIYKVIPKYTDSWTRIRGLVEAIGKQIFEEASSNPMQIEKDGQKYWLTTLDMAFLSLFCLYMLIEECWKNHILLLGITKDTTARDFKTHLIPLCLNEKIWNYDMSQEELKRAPNTDRMLLQFVSLYNYEKLLTPWSLIEYDSAFRTIIPELERRRLGYVSGAIRNRITPERLFLKTYIQLSKAKTDPRLRSNVLFIDRLVYPKYDIRENTLKKFKQSYGGAEESIEAILFENCGVENRIQNLVMIMLKEMATTNIPEVFGYNMPLFIADNVAKWHNSEIRRIINSTGLWITNNKNLRKFIFYMSTFRERRDELEQIRRGS
jgi:hypothetical protein